MHLGMFDMESKKYGAKMCRFYYNNTKNIFWAIEDTGKMPKFWTVSSQICILRHIQRTLLLSSLVCIVPFGGHDLWERYKKRVDPCLYCKIVLLFHASYIKVKKSLKFKGT